MNAKLVGWVILVGFLVVFSAQNYEVVEVRFLLWRLAMSRAVLLLLVMAIGVGIGWYLATLRRRK